MRRIICRVVGHRRSVSMAYQVDDGTWHSRCKLCGAKLVRVAHACWRAVANASDSTSSRVRRPVDCRDVSIEQHRLNFGDAPSEPGAFAHWNRNGTPHHMGTVDRAAFIEWPVPQHDRAG